MDPNNSNIVEIQNADNSIDEAKMISLIINLLQQGKYIIYNPVSKPGYNSMYYDLLKSKIDIYKSLELVFVPEITSYEFTDFFRPKIQTNMPMFFSPGNEILIKVLSMFLSLGDLSNDINYGCYEFISRIRIGYLFPPKKNNSLAGGSVNGGQLDEFINNYQEGLEDMYGNTMSGGINKLYKTDKTDKISKKHTITYKKRKHINKKGTVRRERKPLFIKGF
jgi:hypothetical protein